MPYFERVDLEFSGWLLTALCRYSLDSLDFLDFLEFEVSGLSGNRYPLPDAERVENVR